MSVKTNGFVRTAVIGLAIAACIQGAFMLFSQFYGLGIDPQSGQRSTPHQLFLIIKNDTSPVVGELFAFSTDDRHTPWFTDMQMVKRVVASEGSKVHIDDGSLIVDGVPLADRNQRILDKIADKRPGYALSFPSETTVPAGQYLMLTDSEDGFDGRYWGFVDQSAIRGRAVPLY